MSLWPAISSESGAIGMQVTSHADPVPKQLLGQPRGLATLFLTEMWERFSYYGMRAILILYIVAAAREGGLGLDDHVASAIYGLYIAATYVFALFGGWMADRLLGAQRAVIAGGILIMLGNTLLVVGGVQTFFLGLVVIVLGVGLLKPNISVMVAELYPEGGARRDAGFSIFYVGISVGALLGSLLVPLAAAHYGWRWGFALPVVGMLLGLTQFMLTRKWLGHRGRAGDSRVSWHAWLPVAVLVLAVATIAMLALTGGLTIKPIQLAAAASWVIALFAVAYFAYLIFLAGLSREERRRVYVMAALFAAYAAFFAGFEQGGASLNLFAERYTDRRILGWEMPAGVLQGATAFYTILFAPAFAALWLALGKRGKDPAPSTKFASGLALLAAGYLVLYVAAGYVVGGIKVLPTWLLLAYFLQECGDLCLSPVGLSSMTKLAPPRFVGQVMGVWFLALALGNNMAGQLSGEYDARDLNSLPALFLKIAAGALIAAAIMFALTPTMKRLMGGVK
jgi:proton-dependent oligopeptide transporter, POT family